MDNGQITQTELSYSLQQPTQENHSFPLPSPEATLLSILEWQKVRHHLLLTGSRDQAIISLIVSNSPDLISDNFLNFLSCFQFRINQREPMVTLHNHIVMATCSLLMLATSNQNVREAFPSSPMLMI